MLTEAQLRGVLQLPARPFNENILSDGSRYYDLSHFEPLTIYSLVGTLGPFQNHPFVMGTDFVLNNGVLDFGAGGASPTLGTSFEVDYSYSSLGAASVSTSMWIASTTVAQQLASAFPYNQISLAGVAYNDLATLGTLMVAARESCAAMAASEIENAVKYRRGAIQMDETAKTKNWLELSHGWETKYQKYINMIRPGGRPSGLIVIARTAYAMVFPTDGNVDFPDLDYLSEDIGDGYGDDYAGVL
jgi:hypothetical protein